MRNRWIIPAGLEDQIEIRINPETDPPIRVEFPETLTYLDLTVDETEELRSALNSALENTREVLAQSQSGAVVHVDKEPK